MTTMAVAIKQYVAAANSALSGDEIKRHIEQTYPNQWKTSTVTAHLYGCVVNNPKAYLHHPSTEKFLFKNPNHTYELYSEEKHGVNEWLPTEGDIESSDESELVEASVSLERDIEDHLVHSLESIEQGLVYEDRQVSTEVGRIDIMARDRDGRRVIIEVKVGQARDAAIGQIARYMGWFLPQDDVAPRGMIVAADFTEGVQCAATTIPDLSLHRFQVSFSFEKVRYHVS